MIKTGPIFGVLWIHDHHKHNGIEVLRTAKRRDEDIGLLRKHLRHHLRLLRGLGDALIGQR